MASSSPTTAACLRRDDGTLYGSFIHFDVEPRSIAEEEVAFLQDVIPLFLDYLD